MGNRRKSREIAVQILYQLEISNADIDDAIKTFWDIHRPAEDQKEFTITILKGVLRYRSEIDTIIMKSSDHWSLKRMSHVDRSILREALYELLYCPDIPLKVTIDEAVELAKKFGTEKSGSFINGILDKVAHQFSDKKPAAHEQ